MASAAAFSPEPSERPKSVLAPRFWKAWRSVAKSTLMSPVLESIDQIDFTPLPIHSSARANESSTVSFSAASCRRMSFGSGITASHDFLRASRPSSACLRRRPPSKLKGSVTKAITRAPCSAAISATVGEAPPPVPPPIPARMNTRSQSLTTAAIFSRSSSAASRPSSGSPPAPRPRVVPMPIRTLSCTGELESAWLSVLITASWSRSRLSILSRSTAFVTRPCRRPPA